MHKISEIAQMESDEVDFVKDLSIGETIKIMNDIKMNDLRFKLDLEIEDSR